MHQHGFICALDSEPVPGIAKMWHSCQLGCLPAWLFPFAYQALTDLLAKGCNIHLVKQLSTGIFVLPEGSSASLTKTKKQKYGTVHCSRVVEGGGPFILTDQRTVPEELLRRLGFLDDKQNSDFEEGILKKSATDLDLMEYLKSYARQKKLLQRKTFNGLVTQFLQNEDRSPRRRPQDPFTAREPNDQPARNLSQSSTDKSSLADVRPC